MQELVGVLSADEFMSLLIAASLRLGWRGLLTGSDTSRIDRLLVALGYVLEKAA